MADLKTITDIEQRIEKILADAANETTILRESIKKEAEAIASAEKEMEEATVAGDLRAYQEAKSARRDAEDANEMHRKRLERLSSEPLVSAVEYEKMVSSVYAEIAALESATKEKLAKYSDAMNAAALELQEASNYANKVLHRAQYEVFREADRRRNGRGVMITASADTKEVNTWETINWGKAGVQGDPYKQYTGRKGE